jgi:tetratricopeptide (TPR) repeat protein
VIQKKASIFFVSIVAALLIAACSTKKDGFLYREYHNTTAHFNGFFNAGESVRKGLDKIYLTHKEDYDEILPIFIYGDTAAARASYPEMEVAIEKCQVVIKRHTIQAEAKKTKHPVFNKWIDDNYMLLGRAQFYKGNYFKAEEMFQYVSRKYKDPDVQINSAAWIARAAIAKEEYSKALQALSRVEVTEKIDDDIAADYYQVFTDLYIHQGKLKEAAEKMEQAIKLIDKKKNRARPHFILAQIYQRLRESNQALREFDAVQHSRAPYELEFYAKINKALSFNRRGGSSEEIKSTLLKMLRDEKNKEYRDQILYALGDLYLEEQNRPQAIAYYDESLKATLVSNKKQKAKTYLKLADLYFDQRQYANAQAYYDSTKGAIPDTHPRYSEVKARAESLAELIGFLNTIELNDSLVILCGLSESERAKKLKDIQKQMENDLSEQKRKDEEAAAKAAQAAATEGGVSGTFWCYNSSLRDKGLSFFQDYWGDRPLKDNWRLNSKLASSFGTPDESVVEDTTSTAAATEAAEDKYKAPSVEDLASTLPCDDPAKMSKSTAAVAEAYYQSGLIYKEKLDDEDNAINSWEQLVTNLDSSAFHPMAYYQLFRTWLDKEAEPGHKPNPFCGNCSSAYWGDVIKSKYPGSEWARLVDNPAYLDVADLKLQEEELAYEQAYRLYTSRNYYEAITACLNVIETQPDNHFICKYRLLRAICIGYTDAAYSIKENYFKELLEVKKNCGGTEEAKRADAMLKAGNQEAPIKPTNPVIPTPDQKPGETGTTNQDTATTDPKPAGESPFKMDASAEHYFAVLLPIQGTDVNKTKADISDFNLISYASLALKVTNNLLDKSNHIVLVKPFKSLQEAKEYRTTFTTNKDKLQGINVETNTIFLISKQNYISLFKTKDISGYLQFYQDNYPN